MELHKVPSRTKLMPVDEVRPVALKSSDASSGHFIMTEFYSGQDAKLLLAKLIWVHARYLQP